MVPVKTGERALGACMTQCTWRGCVHSLTARLNLNKVDVALKDADEAVALDPKYSKGHYRKGQVRTIYNPRHFFSANPVVTSTGGISSRCC